MLSSNISRDGGPDIWSFPVFGSELQLRYLERWGLDNWPRRQITEPSTRTALTTRPTAAAAAIEKDWCR